MHADWVTKAQSYVPTGGTTPDPMGLTAPGGGLRPAYSDERGSGRGLPRPGSPNGCQVNTVTMKGNDELPIQSTHVD